ncbi:caspase family protein [Anabaena sp. FACHB-1237]|uniref:caspase family protein n=1 Tax=Anabaena sp. FACHB-1237 TaxID=2692769 RepID=UPI0016808E6C|nr:caspase family protein [Anabaena sp. FACHB-1237]MBD2136881.1 caspase family protein [Anabaena sp. FACHB-1237]
MVNYWAIAIGINQYQLFQPLSCTEADAEAIKEYLVNVAGFPPQNCLLMTNTSVPIQDESTFPTKENIVQWMEKLVACCQPQDYLWLFFSGYGVNYQNKDYLMPVDGNPEQIVETGIELRSLMHSIHLSGIKSLFIFDINRAFGTQADAPVGAEIIAIAEELQQSAIISCQPEEFSHESTELGHGFFTAALLEGLHCDQGYNFSELAHYLTDLTPKLCQHHWRPLQHPVTFVPSPQPAILPVISVDTDSQAVIFPEESFATAVTAAPQPVAVLETIINPTITPAHNLPIEELNKNGNDKTLVNSPEATTNKRYIPKVTETNISTSTKNLPIWQQFMIWGGGSMTIVAILATFVLRNPRLFRIFSTTPSHTANIQLQATPNAENTTSGGNNREKAILELEKMSLRATQVSDLTVAIITAKKVQPEQPLYEQAQENIQVWSQIILELAEEKARKEDYQGAISAVEVITQEQSLYNQVQTAIEKWKTAEKQFISNKTLLDAAKKLIIPGQASSYNRAIALAKKIPKGQPGFENAQISINGWSEAILELAKARAIQKDFASAIATAALVPDVTIAYDDAQDAIKKWQQQK